MRARTTGDADCAQFAAKLLLMGNGNIPYIDSQQTIMLPENFGTVVSSLDILKRSVYPHLSDNLRNPGWLKDRAILAPKNSVVDSINASLLAEMDGVAKTYLSIDSVCDPDEAVAFPTELLNSLNISGLPPHKLELKIGAPVMLLRNIGILN